MDIVKSKSFKNGTVYCLRLADGMLIEMTDTSIKISNIEIDRCHEDGEMIIDLENIESNSCNYVYYD